MLQSKLKCGSDYPDNKQDRKCLGRGIYSNLYYFGLTLSYDFY